MPRGNFVLTSWISSWYFCSRSLNMLLLEAAQMKEESRRIIVRLGFYLTITISCIALALVSHDYTRNQLVRTCERILFQRENFRKVMLVLGTQANSIHRLHHHHNRLHDHHHYHHHHRHHHQQYHRRNITQLLSE